MLNEPLFETKSNEKNQQSKLKRALFLIDAFNGGGVERSLSYVVRKLHGEKFQIIICPYLAESSLSNLAQSYHQFSEETILPALVKFRRKTGRPWYITVLGRSVAAFFTFHKLLISQKEFQSSYRFVRNFLYNYYFSIQGLKDVLQKQKPELIVAFARNSALIALTTRFLYGIKIPIYCSHRGHLSKRIFYKPNGGLFRFLARRFYKRADFHVAVSNGICQDVIDHFHVPASRIATLYNGVDIEFIRAQCAEPIADEWIRSLLSDQNTFKIINVGRLSESKGQQTLIRAFQKVAQKFPCHLFIIGKGENKEYLQGLIQKLKLKDRIHLLEWDRNPFKFAAPCDLFVSSSYSEGFPNVLLEAMAIGLPIIAADCEFGPRELLDDGKYGILVPIKDEQALANAMSRVLTDHDLRIQLRSKSLERIKEFSVEIMVNKYEELCSKGRISNP
jgi:glycosyltransferase involved in cell wall biosynthesis